MVGRRLLITVLFLFTSNVIAGSEDIAHLLSRPRSLSEPEIARLLTSNDVRVRLALAHVIRVGSSRVAFGSLSHTTRHELLLNDLFHRGRLLPLLDGVKARSLEDFSAPTNELNLIIESLNSLRPILQKKGIDFGNLELLQTGGNETLPHTMVDLFSRKNRIALFKSSVVVQVLARNGVAPHESTAHLYNPRSQEAIPNLITGLEFGFPPGDAEAFASQFRYGHSRQIRRPETSTELVVPHVRFEQLNRDIPLFYFAFIAHLSTPEREYSVLRAKLHRTALQYLRYVREGLLPSQIVERWIPHDCGTLFVQ